MQHICQHNNTITRQIKHPKALNGDSTKKTEAIDEMKSEKIMGEFGGELIGPG